VAAFVRETLEQDPGYCEGLSSFLVIGCGACAMRTICTGASATSNDQKRRKAFTVAGVLFQRLTNEASTLEKVPVIPQNPRSKAATRRNVDLRHGVTAFHEWLPGNGVLFQRLTNEASTLEKSQDPRPGGDNIWLLSRQLL
jgi:hypothetical protein